MSKITRFLTTLVALFAMTAGAWADGTVYNTAVALKDLKVGDVLTDGFSLTTAIGQYINFKGYKKDDGSPVSDAYQQLDANGVTFPGGVTISKSGSNYTPYVDSKDANAWIVSDFKNYGSATMLYLDGYNYTPAAGDVTYVKDNAGNVVGAEFEMPSYDRDGRLLRRLQGHARGHPNPRQRRHHQQLRLQRQAVRVGEERPQHWCQQGMAGGCYGQRHRKDAEAGIRREHRS